MSSAVENTATKPLGMRKNGFAAEHLQYKQEHAYNSAGKQWHVPRKAFRPGSGQTSYEQRAKDRVAIEAMKAKEKEMKDEKEAERQVRGRELVTKS